MSTKKNGKNFSMQSQVIERRKKVLGRLKDQLRANTKNTREGVMELNESDLKRINKEVKTLENRI